MMQARYAVLVGSLSLLLAGTAVVPQAAYPAGWISDMGSFASDWVAKIEQELSKKEYRYVFANDPRTPQASVIRLLNRAAQAQAAHDETMAKDLVRDAMEVLQDGVRRNYYSAADIEPILKHLREQIPIKLS